MEDLDSNLTKVERDLSGLQSIVSQSLRNASDSGIPEKGK
jgi:hypothetical protein